MNARAAKMWAQSEEKLQRFADISYAMFKYIKMHSGTLTDEIADLIREPAEYDMLIDYHPEAPEGETDEARILRECTIYTRNKCQRLNKMSVDINRCFPYIARLFIVNKVPREEIRRALHARNAVIKRLVAKRRFTITKAAFDRIDPAFRITYQKRIVEYISGLRPAIIIGKGKNQRRGPRTSTKEK